jgi:hypothetical protein
MIRLVGLRAHNELWEEIRRKPHRACTLFRMRDDVMP